MIHITREWLGTKPCRVLDRAPGGVGEVAAAWLPTSRRLALPL